MAGFLSLSPTLDPPFIILPLSHQQPLTDLNSQEILLTLEKIQHVRFQCFCFVLLLPAVSTTVLFLREVFLLCDHDKITHKPLHFMKFCTNL